MKFVLQITFAAFLFLICIGPSEEILVLALNLSIFAVNEHQLLPEPTE